MRPIARRIGLGLLVLALPAALIAGTSARRELVGDFRPARRAVALPSEPELAALHSVTFTAAGVTIRGSLLAPQGGAAVALLHGADADRSQMLPEARILARHGFAVLIYDSPGHGESDGRVTWDEGERAALRAALDRLAIEPGVDPRRLGVLGFSMGSIIAAQVAAGDARVRGAVLTGAISDFAAQIRLQNRRYGPLSAWPAVQAARYAGMDLDHGRPMDVIAQVAPRPVLFVAGSEDTVVPLSMTRELFDAAREPRALFVIEGAGHGRYAEVAGADYERRLVAFFEDALRPAR